LRSKVIVPKSLFYIKGYAGLSWAASTPKVDMQGL